MTSAFSAGTTKERPRESSVAHGPSSCAPPSKKLKVESDEHEKTKKDGMQRYLVTLEYMGTRYSGFQRQKSQGRRTIQGALEDAFSKFVGKPVESAGSSRTDVGVHALRNTCHVDVERVSKRRPGEILPPHEPEVVKRAVNHFLQRGGEEVQVVDVQCVSSSFHARFEAKERIYHYRILVCKDGISLFEKDRAWHVHEELDIQAMQQACRHLVGHHDFSSFRASGCQASSPIRTLDELSVCEMPSWPCFPALGERTETFAEISEQCESDASKADTILRKVEGCDTGLAVPNNMAPKPMIETDGPGSQMGVTSTHLKPRCFVVTARARSFLYHQVRLMVGFLKAVGSGERKADDVKHLLEARSVMQMPEMAPSCGLYLADVKYDAISNTP